MRFCSSLLYFFCRCCCRFLANKDGRTIITRLCIRWRRLHRARVPTFTNGRARAMGAPWVDEQRTRNHQTVLTITKALTKTTNCTFRAKNVEGQDQKNFFSGALRRTGAPTFKIVSATLSASEAVISRFCPFAWLEMEWVMRHPFVIDCGPNNTNRFSQSFRRAGDANRRRGRGLSTGWEIVVRKFCKQRSESGQHSHSCCSYYQQQLGVRPSRPSIRVVAYIYRVAKK